MTLVTYPLNNVEYQAEDAELFHCTRNSGIYAGDDFAYSVTGADNSIVINPGVGWIRNNRFSGKVFAMRTAQSIDLGLPDSVYPRIDAIVIRFEANSNQTELVVKMGIPSSSPTSPTVSQTESLYELHLYHVYREAGAVSFSVADITDLRMNANYCGLMADSVTSVDTSAINAQIEALVVQLREDILAVKTGSAYVMRDGTTAMTGDLGMGGHRVTNMAVPNSVGDAVNLGYANEHYRRSDWKPTAEEIGAVPAGYGHGETSNATPTNGDANEIHHIGSYQCNKNCPTDDQWYVIPNIHIPGVYEDQVAIRAVDGAVCFRVMSNGYWGPWCWENPPMEYGVPYPTTERIHNGNIVYTELIRAGEMPDDGPLDVELGDATTMPNYPFREEIYAYDNDWYGDRKILTGGYFTKDGKKYFGVEQPKTGMSASGYHVYLRIWYYLD